jgi:hypothetical protein
MVYNSSTQNWTSTLNLESQNISGGQYWWHQQLELKDPR